MEIIIMFLVNSEWFILKKWQRFYDNVKIKHKKGFSWFHLQYLSAFIFALLKKKKKINNVVLLAYSQHLL